MDRCICCGRELDYEGTLVCWACAKFVAGIPCQKTLIFMTTPIDECVRRNAQRINPLPEFMVIGMYNAFEPPNFDEGWDEIIEVVRNADGIHHTGGICHRGGRHRGTV